MQVEHVTKMTNEEIKMLESTLGKEKHLYFYYRKVSNGLAG